MGSVPQDHKFSACGNQAGVHLEKDIPITWQLWVSLNLIGGRLENFLAGIVS